MKLKELHFAAVAEIQAAVTDELKKAQKEEFSAAFQKLYDRAKACIYANGTYFEFKKKVYIFEFKKVRPRTFGPRCVIVHSTKLTEHISHIIRPRLILILFFYIFYFTQEGAFF
jgi:hypothetical protein